MQADVPIVRWFTFSISNQLPCARRCGPLKPIAEGKMALIAIEIEEALAGKGAAAKQGREVLATGGQNIIALEIEARSSWSNRRAGVGGRGRDRELSPASRAAERRHSGGDH